jgi:hypothetical protein
MEALTELGNVGAAFAHVDGSSIATSRLDFK